MKKQNQKNPNGAFTAYFHDRLPWFREQFKRLGMSGSALIMAAVEEYVERRGDDEEII